MVGSSEKSNFLKQEKKMFEVAKYLTEKDFFLRLNTIPHAEDAVANDVEYHQKCWVLEQREAHKVLSSGQSDIQEIEDVNRKPCS